MKEKENNIEKIIYELGVAYPKQISSDEMFKNINDIEQENNIALPSEYKEFLLKYNGVYFENEIQFKPLEKTPQTTKDGFQLFDSFFGITGEDSLTLKIEQYKHRMSTSLIPIGECPGGNLVCLGIKGDRFGKIYFWNHENEFEANLLNEQNIELYKDNLYVISNSFIDFMNELNIISQEENLDISGVELWLDDDLLDD